MLSTLYRKTLYLAFMLLSGVSPAYDKRRGKKIDKAQLNKETQNPHEVLKFELENNEAL